MTEPPVFTPNGSANEPHREKYVVAVFSTNRFDSARMSGVTHSVADASGGRGDVVKSIEFEPRTFARDTLAKAMQAPRNAGGLPPLVRVPSEEGGPDEHPGTDMREWRHGFTEEALEPHDSDHAALEADGILILLPAIPQPERTNETQPDQRGEAIAARYSLWLMMLLIELQRVREARRGQPRSSSIPIAFAVTGADERTGRQPPNLFARETDLFRLALGDTGVLSLSDDRRDGLKIVKYFADRLSSPSSAIVWSSPTDTLLAHTPAVAYRHVRNRRVVKRATAAIAAIGVLGVGYQLIGPRISAPGGRPTLEATANVALAAALDESAGIPDRIRRARLNEALELCKRPAANCPMNEVLRLGYELRRLRNRPE